MTSALFSRLNLLLWGGVVVITAVGFALVPEQALLPVHWGLSGQPDAFWPRSAALLLVPVTGVLTSMLFWLIERFAGERQVAAGRHAWAIIIPALTGLWFAMQGAIVLIGLGQDVPMVRVIALAIAVLLVVMGNVMPKTQPNRLAGLRLPWTMEAANWQATHRFTGLLFMLCGAALLLGALMISEPAWLAIAMMLAVLVPCVAGGVYSYRRRGQSGVSQS